MSKDKLEEEEEVEDSDVKSLDQAAVAGVSSHSTQIIGSWQFSIAVNRSIYSVNVFENLVWSLVFAIAIIGISSLGISAASSENICGLITFAGFMGVGMIITLISGFYVVTNKKGYSENISLYFNSFEIAIGICFGFSILALLGLLISLFMIHQIKHHDRSPGEYSMAMNIVQTEASGPLTSALLQEEPAVKA